ncbi:hypothetical protein LCGC14_1822500 [marine sediment metagenome]|uniref:Uncharacterized protein n=1 Tax=marine sediment metagenome TaxID=412755 RepID=A0A0F9GIG8_9ZZZZ
MKDSKKSIIGKRVWIVKSMTGLILSVFETSRKADKYITSNFDDTWNYYVYPFIVK